MLRICSLVVGALLWVPAPAGAVAQVVGQQNEAFSDSSIYEVSPPQFAGGDVVYRRNVDRPTLLDAYAYNLRAATPGGGERTVRTFRGAAPFSAPSENDGGMSIAGEYARLTFTASSGVLVTRYERGSVWKHGEPNLIQIEVGPVDGPPRVLEPCYGVPVPGPGGRIAYARCVGDVREVVVEEVAGGTATGTSPPLGVADSPEPVAVAGDLLAFRRGAAGERVVVWNLAEGRELYRVDSSRSSRFALSPDGKLVRVIPAGGTDPAACAPADWFSPAEPTPHRISDCARGNASPRIANDRIALSETVAGVPTLLVRDLNGTARVVTRGATKFDFDGARITYVCQGTDQVVLDDLAGEADPSVCERTPQWRPDGRQLPGCSTRADVSPRVSCPVRIGPRVTLDRQNRPVVEVKCVVGCRMVLHLRRRYAQSSAEVGQRAVVLAPTRSKRIKLANPIDRPRSKRGHAASVQVEVLNRNGVWTTRDFDVRVVRR